VDQLQSLLETSRGGGEAVEGFFKLHKVTRLSGHKYSLENHCWVLSVVFLCPVNLIRDVVGGEGFVRPVQALVFP